MLTYQAIILTAVWFSCLPSISAHIISLVHPSANLNSVYQRQDNIPFTSEVPTHMLQYGTNPERPATSAISAGNASQDLRMNMNAIEEEPTRMLVMGYYPDWVVSGFPPSRIDFRRFDWMDFAFAVPNADGTLTWDDSDAPGTLNKLVSAAHSSDSKVKLSIGGWTGSRHFSAIMATEQSRQFFISNIVAIYGNHDLDGIEIDWEYPGHEGASGNKFNANDTANFLLFLRSLRAALPLEAIITAAVESTPFVDGNGRPLDDVSEFAEVLDWVLIMNYDLWGSSSHPGPNAPLYDACGNSTQPAGSALGSYTAWTKAKFPPYKLVLGLPSYGYVSSSIAKYLQTRSKSRNRQHQHSTSVKITSGDSDSDSQVQFRDLILQGALSPSSHESGHGFERLWDSCSCTPYLRSAQSKQVIAFDDPASLAMKAVFARKVGMRGVNLFDVHGDTDDWDLIDAVRKSLDVLPL